ncbi:MAG TPA: hypothetical protein VK081_03755, partial [Planctomycetota bacterium]|nr:hypothetical protein [Planctomycetota bacterium]
DGWMSTAVTTGATVNANFDANHGSDKTQALTNRTVNFPPYGTEIIPYPFIYTVPLDVPFNFGGTGPLCWEVQITSRPAGASMFHDYVGGSATNPSFAVSRYGADGCIATGRTQAFALTGGSSVTWSNLTGQLTATASQGPANAPALYAFGMSGTSHFGVPLPAQLPNTAGFPSGACFLNTELLFTVFGTLSSAGGATFRLDLPLDPSFGGTNLFGQVAALDASANALGLVTTNGINHHIVAPHGNPPGGRIYLSGSLGATGNVGANQTLVVQFTTP